MAKNNNKNELRQVPPPAPKPQEKQQFKKVGGTPLGSIAKSSPTYGVPDAHNKTQEARAKRYALSREIRKAFIKEGQKRFPLIPTKYHRQSLCKWAMTGEMVDVLKDEATAKAFFTGVQTCGSVWCCPVCANRIQEVRRQEIARGMAYFYELGKQAVMVTLTFPHTLSNSLKELRAMQSEALKKLRKGNSWDLFKARIGFEGLIRSLEVTRGGNGWHPHTHELWFCNSVQDEEEFKKFLVNKWLKACLSVGLVTDEPAQIKAFLQHSVDVRFNCDSSDYLAKVDDKANWGVDREIAKASSKLGKAKGMHPFELAFRGYHNLWIEYAEVFHGQSQLYWSQGLKKRVGIGDKTDEDIAKEEAQEEPQFMDTFTKDEWFKILQTEQRANILSWLENGYNAETVRSFIFNSEAVKNE